MLHTTPSVVGIKDGVWVTGEDALPLLDAGCAVMESKRLLGVSEFKLNGQVDLNVQQTMQDTCQRSNGLGAAFESRPDTAKKHLTFTCESYIIETQTTLDPVLLHASTSSFHLFAVNSTPKQKKLVPELHALLFQQILTPLLKTHGISDITQVSGKSLKVVLTVPAHFKHVSTRGGALPCFAVLCRAIPKVTHIHHLSSPAVIKGLPGRLIQARWVPLHLHCASGG